MRSLKLSSVSMGFDKSDYGKVTQTLDINNIIDGDLKTSSYSILDLEKDGSFDFWIRVDPQIRDDIYLIVLDSSPTVTNASSISQNFFSAKVSQDDLTDSGFVHTGNCGSMTLFKSTTALQNCDHIREADAVKLTVTFPSAEVKGLILEINEITVYGSTASRSLLTGEILLIVLCFIAFIA